MTKIKCNTCNATATWMYMPSGSERYYCDSCVPRGCGCNFDENNENEYKDNQGRSLPCCEYSFDQNGFDIVITSEDYNSVLEEIKELWINNDGSEEDFFAYEYNLYLIENYERSN